VKRDFLFSFFLHILIAAVAVFAAPLDLKRPTDFIDVIRVGVVSMPEVQAAPAEALPELVTPQAIEAEPEEMPISDPTTRPAVEIEEPEKPEPEKPKPEPPKEKPKPQPSTVQTPTGDESQAGADEGDIDVETPTGGAISGATVSNAEFKYTYWFNLAFNKISQNYRLPFAIDGRVQCKVYFEVIKSGRVIDMRIIESSGIDDYDDAALAAIGRAAPFPPLPRKYLPEIIGLTITFANR